MRVLRAIMMSVLIFIAAGVADVRCETVPLQEKEIKAAYLFNFAKFVEWPSSSFKDALSPLTICTIGKDPFDAALDSLKDKTAEGRPVLIRRAVKPDEAERCHILYVSASERDNLAQIFKALRNRSVLTVGDFKGFAQAGGIINLVPAGNRITFEINLSAAEKTSLKISSKLLKLGKIIRE